MAIFEHKSTLKVGPDVLYRYHCHPGAFFRLTPPWEMVRVQEPDTGIEEGLVKNLLIGPKPFQLKWQALHENFIEDEQFVDRQLKGPFAHWTHHHRFQDQGPGETLLHDHIEFQFPFNLPLAGLLNGKFTQMFRYRHRQTRRDLELIDRFPSPLFQKDVAPMRIGITGASGLLGRNLASFLQVAGHQVVPLKRAYGPSVLGTANWWPEPDLEALEGLDVVVHLAGETVGQLWTKSAREKILFSRAEGTKRLSRALAQLKKPPKTLISASATGYYEQQSESPVTEEADPGSDFLSQVCQAWEHSTEDAEQAGIRVCHIRLGLVVSSGGGFMAPQLPAFRLGLGPVMGHGQQMQSFVDIDDVVGAIYHLVNRDDLSGPFNTTAPNPVTQAEFAQILASAYGRPQWLKVPEMPARILLRDQADMIFRGVAALPGRLESSGYEFLSPTLTDSLKHQMSLP